MEYVPDLFFDFIQNLGGVGEDAGRFFMTQLINAISYMHEDKGVVHRDLKLENILIDGELNLKLADFGFATFNNISELAEYRGTKTYMAPEIKEGKVYDGKKADIFSIGVILFIVVQGIYPFKEARQDDCFYNLLLKNRLDFYWLKTGGTDLSP